MCTNHLIITHHSPNYSNYKCMNLKETINRLLNFTSNMSNWFLRKNRRLFRQIHIPCGSKTLCFPAPLASFICPVETTTSPTTPLYRATFVNKDLPMLTLAVFRISNLPCSSLHNADVGRDVAGVFQGNIVGIGCSSVGP